MTLLKIHKTLPHPDTVKLDLPRTDQLKKQIHRDRQELRDIIAGKDSRKILVIGPCSAWPSEAVLDYAKKLSKLAQKFSQTLKIVLRVYTQKPRTTIGWTGSLTQPDPFASADIEKGIYYCRKMMLRSAEMGIALADEALFTHNDGYFVDVLSWIAIGARSAEDQEHRIFASMIPHPVGLKNPTSGDITIGINSVIVAQNSHIFSLHGKQVQTAGNQYAHLILRGGAGKSNCRETDLQFAVQKMKEKKIKNPSLIIDASHGNSIDQNGKKNHLQQEQTIFHVLEYMKRTPSIRKAVKGFMVESFLLDGNQSLEKAHSLKDITYGQSITDACIGWEKTEKLITSFSQYLEKI
jgi:3-deoxy-7-phosphoheptulonate synthase